MYLNCALVGFATMLQHPLMSKIGVQPAAEPNTPKRSAWDKARTDLLIAQQLAMYRQQLAKLIQEHSRRLEAHRYRLTEQEVHSMIRGELGNHLVACMPCVTLCGKVVAD